MPRKLRPEAVTSPEIAALLHTLDALDWASEVDPRRIADVQGVCRAAAGEARDKLLRGLCPA